MTTARLSYNTYDIDFIYGAKVWQAGSSQEFYANKSTAGVIERINTSCMIEVSVELFFGTDIHDDLYDWWWTWGRLGYEFEFGLNSSKMVTTTLDGAAAAAQKVIPLTATTGLTAGDKCVLVADANQDREIVTIASVSAGVSVTAVDNLKSAFSSGDEFRHLDYYPALVSSDKIFNPKSMGGNQYYTLSASWTEVLGYTGALLQEDGVIFV